MTLVRWEPARELHSLQHEMNRLFGSFFDSPTVAPANGSRRWVPAMDLVETETQFVLRADLPGLAKDDVKIELDDNVLTVSGERRSEKEERSEGGHHRVERAYGSFSRSLTLPPGIDGEQIDADYSEGVLEIRIPKPAQKVPHRVTIGDGAPQTVEAGESTTTA
jgi:HSP20 family protein